MSNLNIILIVVFIVAAVGATLIFAGIIPIAGGPAALAGTVNIWGTIPSRDFLPLTDAYSGVNRNITVNYRQISPTVFDEALAEALATGTGPDIFLLSSDSVLKHRAKIFPIPFSNYPENTFRQDFIAGAELFLTSDGILGLPLIVDPLVMFYNRTIFDNAGVAKAPEFWDEFPALVPQLTHRQNASIIQSGVALGGARNISRVKDVISALILQTGNPIVTRSDDTYESVLDESESLSALDFYTGFANSTLDVYSWNESLPNARTAFAAGNVAIYFGPASELFTIRDANPNLDFDVKSLPQVRDGDLANFGRVYAFAINRNSTNLPVAATAVFGLSAANVLPFLTSSLSLPPARRDLLAAPQTGTYLPIFYRSALQARGWFDPDPARTGEIFRRMASDVITGRADTSEALSDAAAEIELLLQR